LVESSVTIIESQPDWLTCSAHGNDIAANLRLWAKARIVEQHAAGNRIGLFRSEGYEGQHCGAVDWGQRDAASTLVRLSGQLASEHLAEALSLSDAVTRFDIAVTCRFDPPDPHIGRNAYFLAEQYHAEHRRSALPWRVSDADGGETTYVGKRGSTNMLRVYNKEAECIATGDTLGAERYRGCWRFELAVKTPTAEQLAHETDAREDRAAYVQQYVSDWMDAHGIAAPWPREGGRVLIPGFRRRSDADTKLRHIQKNVRPTVDFLRAVGREPEVIRALGLYERALPECELGELGEL